MFDSLTKDRFMVIRLLSCTAPAAFMVEFDVSSIQFVRMSSLARSIGSNSIYGYTAYRG